MTLENYPTELQRNSYRLIWICLEIRRFQPPGMHVRSLLSFSEELGLVSGIRGLPPVRCCCCGCGHRSPVVHVPHVYVCGIWLLTRQKSEQHENGFVSQFSCSPK